MLPYFVAYAATLAAFAVIDTAWLGLVARPFYKAELGALLAAEVNLTAAVLFYLVYSAGIVVFAISPSLRSTGAMAPLVLGALFGFFAYATYDLTNLATLRDWPLKMTVVDIAWGTALTAVVAFIGRQAARLVG